MPQIPAPPPRAAVTVTELADYHGQPSFRIETPTATYVFHKRGAGFASLVDREGKDWISFRPGGGSDGKFRGIPNVIHPEGGLHPGAETCESTLVESGPERVAIASRSLDGHWACRWRIYPTHAVMDLEKVEHPYWFLYEGTPGGRYDEDAAYVVDSAGRREAASTRWERRLPDPRWIYFGTAGVPRVLFLADLTPRAPDTVDSFWSMQRNMTVFGFGRTLTTKERWHHLTEAPARFVVGLVESTEYAEVARRVNELCAEP